jgi:molybdopterin-containing oxidoreductase family iron-sulfur binding subunit
VVLVTELETGPLSDLAGEFVGLFGGDYLRFEPFAYEPLRAANEVVFKDNCIPDYRIDRADHLVSFNAGFLETWVSNVQYAHYFQLFHQPDVHGHGLHPFVFVGPRNSLTAANADKWVKVKPGDEYLVALGMLRVILDESLAPNLSGALKGALGNLLAGYTLDGIASASGIDSQTIQRLGRGFSAAKHPLALAEGEAHGSPCSLETAVAANLLCSLFPGSLQLLDFQNRSALSDAVPAARMKSLSERMAAGEIELLLVHRANPSFTLPSSWLFAQSLAKVPTVVSFSSWPDETSAHAHLIMPAHTRLESWGEYSPRQNVRELMQPVMGPVFDTRSFGDGLLAMAKKIDRTGKFGDKGKDFHQLLKNSWRAPWQPSGYNKPFDIYWLEMVQKGGSWKESGGANNKSVTVESIAGFSFPTPQALSKAPENGLLFVVYPTVQFYDGRMANRPWIQELPDPRTRTTRGGWAEIHPETASQLKIQKSDLLRIKSEYGEIEAPAIPIFSVPRGVIAVPNGQGHTDFGRYAAGLPANPMALLPDGVVGEPVVPKEEKK